VFVETVIKKGEMGWECSTHGIDEKRYNILVGKPEGKRPF
jgi:hypothetical protein